MTIILEPITTQSATAQEETGKGKAAVSLQLLPPFTERDIYLDSFVGDIPELRKYLAKMDRGEWFIVPGSVHSVSIPDGSCDIDGMPNPARPQIVLQMWRRRPFP